MSWQVRTTVALAAAVFIACASTARAPATVAANAAPADIDAGEEPDGGDGDDEGDDEADDAGTSGEIALGTDDEGPCPAEMVLVESDDVRVCVDRWEASLVEVDADGNEKPYPHWLPVDGHTVRAVSVPDVYPQGYISEVQAEDACAASHKRLCTEVEWMTACVGPDKTTFPYGDARRPTACHDSGRSAVGAVFGLKALASAPPQPHPARVAAAPAKKGAKADKKTKGKPTATIAKKATSKSKPTTKKATTKPKPKPKTKGKPPAAAKASTRPSSVEASVWHQLNDPRLGQVDGALAKTGAHEDCTNTYGALDMMGNLHEWVRTPASAAHGTFAGGYYLDTSINGDGCKYRTKAHAHDYHDYSTGFRCCADAR
ncbi:MAG: hypothetical protein KIT84_20805 [Labilithrix sp.]|nr:hypothetical protein [Labilithrix sp.]MCW5813482.1 hypothetical protein [Labilithrix sp.]